MRKRPFVPLLVTLLFCGFSAPAQNSNKELNDQLYEAVRKGDTTAVTSLLDKGADVNAKFRYGATALFKAAERGNLEVVKILLARGADVSVKDTFYGATAMSWALDGGHIDIVNALLDKQPSSVNEVLMSGVSDGKPELAKLALQKGGLSKETLTTALAIASADKDKGAELVDLLKKAGAVPPPEVNPTTLQSYVGKYKSEGAMEVNVSLTEGALTALPVGQRQPIRLIPVDDTTFRPMFFEGMTLKFKVDAGKVTGMTLTQGTNVTQLTRVTETKQ